MSKICTWKDCQAEARHDLTASDGSVWARVCDAHDATITKAIREGNAKKILGAWVLAGGGAEKMARRM